ncbi:MAG: hypothetical protein ACI8W3_001080 [Myxococcota bacterium]|jgi:hypothetical protein
MNTKQVGRLNGVAALGFLALTTLAGCEGEHWGPGTVTAKAAPAARAEVRRVEQRETLTTLGGDADASKQILFGDLHVHTTFSPDAFAMSLPLLGGEGAHPPADACDFARFCSALDFWSVNDHAEGITPRRWAETKESIRQCNDVAGDPENPDMVAFLGWEWSQVNLDKNKHYGHKNVILLDTEEDKVPRRSIAAPRDQLGRSPIGPMARMMLSISDWENRDIYNAAGKYYAEIGETPACEHGVHVKELPDTCHETAADPRALFDKLDEWGYESIVIPHGNAWGLNTPPGTTFRKQLNAEQHDPDRQILFEVFSGHGNSEEYKDWRAIDIAEDGTASCPAPTDDYYPCCWRAGDIIMDRCDGESSEVCEQRVVDARQNYVDAGVTGYWTVPNTSVEDWLGCGQCDDCFQPGFDHRPAVTAQYALAIADHPGTEEEVRFRFGLIGSSDNHSGRPGTGYKEYQRMAMTEANGSQNKRVADRSNKDPREAGPLSIPYDHENAPLGLGQLRHMERQASFFMTGGLVAAHSAGRGRRDLWDTFQRREVYATSGGRILLWFDWLGADGTTLPMGSEVETDEIPRFRVRAAGALEQQPGCPEASVDALGLEGIQSLCRGECHFPGETRHRLTRVEVVRIRPQVNESEDVGMLIEDPWRSFPCPDDASGCTVEFDDPDFVNEEREVIYYVRAIQEPTPAVNAGGLRCERDAEGRCVKVTPCHSDYKTPVDDDCLSLTEERAWSSPIFVR